MRPDNDASLCNLSDLPPLGLGVPSKRRDPSIGVDWVTVLHLTRRYAAEMVPFILTSAGLGSVPRLRAADRLATRRARSRRGSVRDDRAVPGNRLRDRLTGISARRRPP